MNAKFISNGVYNEIDKLKIMLLFYDKIEIAENCVYTLEKGDSDIATIRGAYSCLSEEFKEGIAVLLEEGVVSVKEINDITISPMVFDPEYIEPTELEIEMFRKTKDLLNEIGNKLWEFNPRNNSIKLHPEIITVHEKYLNPLVIGNKIDLEFTFKYYLNLVHSSLTSIVKGENLVTTSEIVDIFYKEYFKQVLKNGEKQLSPHTEIKLIEMYLPDITMLSFEEILDLKIKLRDELIRFQTYVSELNISIQDEVESDKINRDIDYYINRKINHAIDEFKSKITNSRLKIASSFLEQIKSPWSYIPVAGSTIFNLPTYIAALFSASIIGAKVFLDWKSEQIDLKRNGLYYLYKLNKRC